MEPEGRIRGRGAAENPAGRFERLAYEADPEFLEARARAAADDEAWADEEPPALRTTLYRDPTREVLAHNQSPDVGFDVSLNPYRGCEHGCVYCYARPTHEYLGLSAGLDFESKIFVKHDAPALLRRELMKRSWRPRTIAISGVTDAYQPAERRLGVTRGCLEVLAEFRNPVGIVTKSQLVARDRDVLARLAAHGAAIVSVSVTSLDPALQRAMEPRASRPDRRLAAMRALADAGVPVAVMVAPVVPGLTDHEIPRILEAAREHGASAAAWILLRLPFGVKALFDAWLSRHYPERREKVLHRVQEVRGGRLNDPRFGSRMRGEGLYAEQIEQLFDVTCRRLGLGRRTLELDASAFRRPGEGAQGSLF
jgi:DNA repair photolyase